MFRDALRRSRLYRFAIENIAAFDETRDMITLADNEYCRDGQTLVNRYLNRLVGTLLEWNPPATAKAFGCCD